MCVFATGACTVGSTELKFGTELGLRLEEVISNIQVVICLVSVHSEKEQKTYLLIVTNLFLLQWPLLLGLQGQDELGSRQL